MNIRNFKFSLFLLLSTFNLAFAQQYNEVTLAYLENGLNELSNNKKHMALQFLSEELVKGSDIRISILPVSTFPEIQSLIIAGKIDFVIFNSFYYIRHHDFLAQFIKDPIWVVQRGDQDKENYILLTNKQYADQNIIRLQGQRISFYPHYLLMKLYLEHLTKQSNSQDVASFFKKIKHTKTASQAVLDVFFGISDVCIVPKHIFDLTADLNPAIKQKLSIFHQSGEKFLPVLIFDFNHTNPVHNHIHKNLSKIGDTVRGKQLLDMLNIEAIKVTNQEQLKPMQKLFQSHQVLLK